MIFTFDVPPLAGGPGLCDFNSLQSRKFKKTVKRMGSPGGIKPIMSQIGKLELSILFHLATFTFIYFSGFFWTLNYRYQIVPALQLLEAHQMSKSLNLPQKYAKESRSPKNIPSDSYRLQTLIEVSFGRKNYLCLVITGSNFGPALPEKSSYLIS